MQLNMRHRKTGPMSYGILRYHTRGTVNAVPKRIMPPFPSRDDLNWSLRQARQLKSLHPAEIPRKVNRRITILGTQNRLDYETGRMVWSINNISFIESETPILHAVKFSVRQPYVSAPQIPTKYNYSKTLQDAGLPIVSKDGTQMFKFKQGEVVDFVFQNTKDLNGADEIHPWHLHLHNFWVLGFGDYQVPWTPKEETKYKMYWAVERNTFNLYPASWTAIRVKFDNPGIALFRKFSSTFKFHFRHISTESRNAGELSEDVDELEILLTTRHSAQYLCMYTDCHILP